MPIRRLDPLTIDRIAAGEVIERPAAAIKELVENALDAGAKSVEVTIEAGGRRLIRVVDDGHGLDEADLALSVERHATSKIPDGDLMQIATFGFRGEALPSIASVSRLEIRTRGPGASHGLRLLVEDGIKTAIEPCACATGARVEARDLFAATPARLKFLKSDRAEALAAADAVKRLAMAAPHVRFSFATDLGSSFDWPAAGWGEAGFTERLRQALGDDFSANSVSLDAGRDGARLTGRVGLPTYSRPNASQQFLFVNGRAVRDKTLAGALRGAYLDFLPPDRHAVAALFVECEPSQVDVNVHPAKAEVRFRDAAAVRSLIVGAIKQRLNEALHRASTTGGTATILAMRPPHPYRGASYSPRWDWRASPAAPQLAEPAQASFAQGSFAEVAPSAPAPAAMANEHDLAAPLGAARAQLHENYIIAQTRDGVVIVDQHAAHERIVYERLKLEREQGGIERQMLLTPLIVDLDPDAASLIDAHAEELAALGLVLEGFGPGAMMVREAPAAIAQGDLSALVRDLAADLAAEDGAQTLARRLDQRLATFACHHSVRSGRPLKPEEMNALLRTMEATPGAGQCNHGRPTYVELKLTDIERLFGRR
jgi:DNA mismatch repair protein MutL